ncbi:MAG: D-alanyl-D-alanine carboxypeptidase/D-alanyl-D-alanine-endopeptidase [Planctomycetes bacterium]|nr:D-alanyl-D-alanine carboxypeptidase/D-alanyl-D-alanine-endopeptidase [Planctomycetota bacterium]
MLGIVSEMENPKKKGKQVVRSAGEVSLLARSIEQGDLLAQHRPTAMLSGASNTKLFTTAAALTLWGPEHRFETRFASDAPVRDGVLDGDLWVIGGGDPTWTARYGFGDSGSELLRRVVAALAGRGIRSIRGKVVLDERLFVDEPYHPGWPRRDRGEPHALDVGPLLLERDALLITARGDSDGAQVSLDPPCTLFELKSTVRVGAPGSASSIRVARSGDEIRVSGSVAKGASAGATIYSLQPGLTFGGALLAALADRGILVSGGLRRAAEGELAPSHVLVLVPSQVPLREIVKVTNEASDNLFADMLLKSLGARFEGEGSFAAGVRAVRGALQRLGVDASGYGAVDGSGLAADSKLSAATTVELLTAMARSPYSQIFRDSLASGGEAGGTLRKRFLEPAFQGRLFAKTGSLDGATALSGYVISASGETIAFSCITNYDERKGGGFKPDEDRIVRALREVNDR